MPTRILRFACAILGIALTSCGPALVTKTWHPAKPILQPAEPWSPMVPPVTLNFGDLKQIRTGDRGEKIHEATRPSYPAYWDQGAAVRTSLDGKTYEVAFLYDNPSGLIRDISYKQVFPPLP